jgi:hypothetical protein
VDKKLFNQESVLGLKQSGKAFPLNADIGVLKWRLQTKDESLMPLTSKYTSGWLCIIPVYFLFVLYDFII